MILFFYNAALLLGLAVSAPWWLWETATTRKYREGLKERLGWVRGVSERAGRKLIWIHAVSVGEVLASSRLVAMLEEALPEYLVAISTTTRTGQELARTKFGADRVFYCPLDLPWAVRAYLNALKPSMLVLAETEFWPNMLAGCFRRGIPVVVVNARISDRSWPRYKALRGLWRPFLSRLTAVLAQTDTDAERLRALGCEAVTVAGNLKFDVRVSGDSEATRLLESVRGGLRLVVAGSTLEGEEVMLLAGWAEMLKAEANLGMVLGLILAPRHPERFEVVAGLLERSGFAWRRRSGIGSEPLRAGEILLLDSIGELASVYSLAAVAFVGGSLVEAGGHNPLEPAQFGVPVVMGRHYANFRAIVEAMRERDGLVITDESELAGTMSGLLRDEVRAKQVGEAGQRVFEGMAGATARSADAIQRVLSQEIESGGLR